MQRVRFGAAGRQAHARCAATLARAAAGPAPAPATPYGARWSRFAGPLAGCPR